ncbi:metallophosphoesterase [Tundrisphaera sp. TA3]|uniref:metallophosphoesterase n=1 Tax=Tundrisphaera sp. TA3 TaxID=3435775 RepID=UPI003EB97401
MAKRARRLVLWLAPGLGLCWSLLASRGPRSAIEDLPDARASVVALGKRLGRELSPIELTRIARRGDRVLANLTREERWALGRNAVRFRVDRPCIVSVAAPIRSIPFWLADQGFADAGIRLRNEDGEFAVHRRHFPAGVIGLGVNALDHAAQAHYAVLVRGDDGSPVGIEAVGDQPRRAVAATRWSSPFSDRFKPFEVIPEELRGATFVQVAHERRQEVSLAGGRVWKARQPSGPVPDQVVVSFGDDPRHALSWTWRTHPLSTRSVLRIASEGDRGSIREVEGDARPIESDGLLNDPTILRHRVVVADLRPDTRYFYSIGDGTEAGSSPWQSTRTAPDGRPDFGFLYLGDAQCGLERWGDLLAAMARHRPDAGFVLMAGDLVDRGNERTNWDHFFLRAGNVFGSIPLMPVVGNHEYLDRGPEIYRKTFDLPRNGPPGIDPNLVYAFEYSDAFVAVLDSNLAIYDASLASVQARWLDEALSRTRATWKFVSFHHPVHASHRTREYPQLGPAWSPIFEKHGVDLVLQGHDHAYLRTVPMKAGHPASPDEVAPVYVVAVSGDKFCEQDPRGYTAKGFTDVATYQTIDVKVRERRLTYRAFDRDGREVDRLVIDKGRESGDQLAGRPAPSVD